MNIPDGFVSIFPKQGPDWRPIEAEDGVDLHLHAERIELVPNGRRGQIRFSALTGTWDDLDSWLRITQQVREQYTHLHVVSVADPTVQLWLAAVYTSYADSIIPVGATDGHGIQRLYMVFQPRGEFAHLPMQEQYPLESTPTFSWLAAAEEGDMVYLPKHTLYARLQTAMLITPGSGMHRIVLDRYNDNNHRIDTQIWYTDSQGRGFDQSVIIQPVRGWCRHLGTRSQHSDAYQDMAAPSLGNRIPRDCLGVFVSVQTVTRSNQMSNADPRASMEQDPLAEPDPVKRALLILTQWHVDEVDGDAEAAVYAVRLVARLAEFNLHIVPVHPVADGA